MRNILTCFLVLSISCLHSYAQDSSSGMHTEILNNGTFPGGLPAWESYLRRNIDTIVPILNKAEKGTYIVVVRFIISTDGSTSDIFPETVHGYGMEEEVVNAIKRFSRWGTGWRPASKDSKIAVIGRQSFLFVVPKMKASAVRRLRKKRALEKASSGNSVPAKKI